ncbi:2-(1,2-epoxy-1,2-dihydrophenyl)acetyl-CoA isomerase [Halogranum amylolyticum]|uniref:2-(1,2-epoxy-1,2-dihydrophenyl)acetyl-CoA isomerase n=1 Tax=Halogranum amylolyticum TaxID=660520 RepID=A0A1H8UB64_9EURY|nr:enoyl-CoA hydratase-related protein [Halogranum amylolyticum]SEP00469.1 2-(1,2-epoxy-1,2-dihydrophenyl)acetyl-CoA isomerase [Halogranum amylolyticum]
MSLESDRYHERVVRHVESIDDTRVGKLVMERGDETANSFTPSMVDAMTEAVEETIGDVRSLVLTGEGEFSVGADLRSFEETPREMRPSMIDQTAAASNRFIRALRTAEIPVIAAVGGTAAGGGLGFALACDLIVMHEEAVLDTAYARIGLTPDNATPFFLTQTIGPYRARELLFSPRPVEADEAKDLGLANIIYGGSSTEFEDRVMEYATTMVTGPKSMQAETKTLVDTAFVGDLDQHLERERDTIKRISDSESFDEGLTAFFEKRSPEWT